MWIKDKNSQESYIHVCEGKQLKDMRKKALEVRLHDVTIFTIVRDEKGFPIIEYIKYCPFCGVELSDV